MKSIGLPIMLFCLVAGPVAAGDPPANSDVALEDDFDRDELGEGWNSTTGDWKIVDGVLRGSEIADEKHSAATRRVVETKNAVYELKFRFTGDCKAFHFGFDPARGELKKERTPVFRHRDAGFVEGAQAHRQEPARGRPERNAG